MIDGVEMRLGDEWWLVPPLKIGWLRNPKNREKLNAFNVMSPDDPGSIETGISIILAAMRRNYPEITEDVLDEILDVGNIAQVIQAIANVSGLKKTSGEGWKGRKYAGATSTGESQQQPDGPGTQLTT